MDFDDSCEYDDGKAAILKKYDINPETYRQRFRALNVEPDENRQRVVHQTEGTIWEVDTTKK